MARNAWEDRQVMGPIRGSGDFLAYGSPSISAISLKAAEQIDIDGVLTPVILAMVGIYFA